jgi:hypothetical protein
MGDYIFHHRFEIPSSLEAVHQNDDGNYIFANYYYISIFAAPENVWDCY